MTSCCKSTNGLWKLREQAFKELRRRTPQSDYQTEIEDLYEEIFNRKRKLNKPPVLCIFGDDQLYKKFVKSWLEFKFPNIKGFQLQIGKCSRYKQIEKVECFDSEELKTLNMFLKNSFPEKCKYFTFRCENFEFDPVPLAPFHNGLESCLLWVSQYVSLNNFTLDNCTFKTIIESASKVNELDLTGCHFDIDDDIELDANIDYKIEVLNVKDVRSWFSGDPFTENNYFDLATCLSKTKLWDSLERLIISDSKLNPQEIYKIFLEYYFYLKIEY